MQTFLPYPSFNKSLSILDNKRLGKQRVEAMQIISTLEKGSKWSNHPAVLQWKGYEIALKDYYNCCINEFIFRGFNNNLNKYEIDIFDIELPPWFGNEYFHMSHRSRLIQKDNSYRLFFKPVLNIPYLWPVYKNNLIYKDNVFYILGEDSKILKINSIDLNNENITTIVKE